MMTHLFERGATLLLGVAVIVNVGLLGWERFGPRPAGAASYQLRLDGSSTLPSFDSLTPALQKGPDTSGRMFAIRYLSDKCGFCDADTEGRRLEQELQRAGVSVAVLLPRVGDQLAAEKVPQGTPQLSFVSTEWIKRLRLTVTPTFLIVDAHGELIWHNEGTLSALDVDVALSRAAKGAKMLTSPRP